MGGPDKPGHDGSEEHLVLKSSCIAGRRANHQIVRFDSLFSELSMT
jgi:hypothetical protein